MVELSLESPLLVGTIRSSLDETHLQNDSERALLEIQAFLTEIVYQLTNRKQDFQLEIPFLNKEFTQERNFVVFPFRESVDPNANPPRLTVRIIYLLIDDLAYHIYLHRSEFPIRDQIEAAFYDRDLANPILFDQKRIDTSISQLIEIEQLKKLISKAEKLLAIVNSFVEAPTSQDHISLAELFNLIEYGTEETVVQLWNIHTQFRVRDLALACDTAEVGQLYAVLPNKELLLFDDFRRVTFLYRRRLQLICQNPQRQEQLDAHQALLAQLFGSSLDFRIENDPTPKQTDEVDRIKAFISLVEELLGILTQDTSTNTASSAVLSLASRPRSSEDTALEQTGSTETVSTPDATPTNPVPLPDSTATNLQYRQISEHTGYLYNQIVSELKALYDLPTVPLSAATEASLRNLVIASLYNEKSLDQAHFNRFKLGHDIIKELITSRKYRPLFLKLNEELRVAAINQGKPSNFDPLQLDESLARHQVFVTSVLTPSLEESEKQHQTTQDSLSDLSSQTNSFPPSFQQNQETFAKALSEQGFETIKIRNLQLTLNGLLQETGLDAETFFSSATPEQISRLFISVLGVSSITPDQLERLTNSAKYYWSAESARLQNLTGRGLTPDIALLNAQRTFDASSFAQLALQAKSLAEHSLETSTDIRLYTLAGLLTSEELDDPSLREQLIQELLPFYGNSREQVEEALQVLRKIIEQQQHQLAHFIAKKYNHRTIQVYRISTHGLSDEELEVEDKPVNFVDQISFRQRERLARKFLKDLAAEEALQWLEMGGFSEFDGEDDLPDWVKAAGSLQGNSTRPQQEYSSKLTPFNRWQGLRSPFSRAEQLTKPAKQVAGISKISSSRQLTANLVGGLLGLISKDLGNTVKTVIETGMIISSIVSAIQAMFGFLTALFSALPFGGLLLVGGLAGLGAIGINAVTNFVSGGSAATASTGAISTQGAGASTAVSTSGALPATASAPSASLLSTATGTIAPVGAIALTATSVILLHTSTNSAFLDPFNADVLAGETSKLALVKTASPSQAVLANTVITYSLEVVANIDEGTITDITITDTLDSEKIQAPTIALINPPPEATCRIESFTISCTIAELAARDSLTIVYSATTVADTNVVQSDGKTPITNEATSVGTLDGEEVGDRVVNTVNSDGAEIVRQSVLIVEALQRGWWGFYNYHSGYSHLFNQGLWDTSDQSGPPCSSSDNAECPDYWNLGGGRGSNDMFWCTWNVIYAYHNAGRTLVNPDSPGLLTGVKHMRDYFIANADYMGVGGSTTTITYQDIQPGDVLFLGKNDAEGFVTSAHVAIVEISNSSYVSTLDSNNVSIRREYTVLPDGTLDWLGQIQPNGRGRLP